MIISHHITSHHIIHHAVEDMRVKIREKKGISHIITAMQMHNGVADVQKSGLCTLWQLAKDGRSSCLICIGSIFLSFFLRMNAPGWLYELYVVVLLNVGVSDV